MRLPATLLSPLLLLIAAVQLAPAQTPKRPCSVPVTPAVEPGSPPAAYRDCDVDKPAVLRRDRVPVAVRFGDASCATAVVQFVVDTMGLVDTATAMVMESNLADYAVRLVKTLSQWRYAPAELAGAKVRQIVLEQRTLESPDARKVPFVIPPGVVVRGGRRPPRALPDVTEPCR